MKKHGEFLFHFIYSQPAALDSLKKTMGNVFQI